MACRLKNERLKVVRSNEAHIRKLRKMGWAGGLSFQRKENSKLRD